ncbi:MAG: hypothetical protein CAPSK01_003364 [Candidatus Accumulibacter vicinus]|uniref:Uncharacterized protein n=1 Tax=Candidatus Accumulibacter vicinus TaxID=2954382 RepID=A0A084XXQ3_9PROT|nr:MAG: hypothetical protein CAPSK01_003364 [Candidatus Accumulibacter vicinus]
MALVLDHRGKGTEDVRIGDVLFLGDAGHQQMPANQPDDQLTVLGRNAVLGAELGSIHGTEFRVVTAASLADVVEQRRHVEYPATGEITDQLAAQRILMREFVGKKAAQVAQDLQGVLIDGIDMEQIVLHLADNLAEIGQIATQNPELVHPTQLMQHAARLFEDFQKTGAILGVTTEIGVNSGPCMPQGAQGARRHSLQTGVFLHQQESFEHRPGPSVEDVFVDHIQQIVPVLEAFIDRQRPLLRRWRYCSADVQQQDRVDLRDFLGCSVITLHQPFTGPAGVGGSETHPFGECRLVVKQQTIFAPADVQVQVCTQTLQKTDAALQLKLFFLGDEAVLREIFPGVTVAGRTGNPQDCLQIAQPARSFLAVGFQAVRGVLVAAVPLFLFHPFGFEEGLWVDLSLEFFTGILEQFATPGQQACFEQCSLNRQVGGGVRTLFDSAHARSDIESDVVEERDCALELGSQDLVGRLWQQQQDVNVGGGIELAASVTTDRDQSQ